MQRAFDDIQDAACRDSRVALLIEADFLLDSLTGRVDLNFHGANSNFQDGRFERRLRGLRLSKFLDHRDAQV
jgi:hypothetical protein